MRLRPLGQGDERLVQRARTVVPLAAGFAVSATALFSIFWLVGRTAVGYSLAILLPFVLAIFAVSDLGYPRFVLPSIRRQTPRYLLAEHHPSLVGLVWGLDAGSVVTTFRASAASWAGIALLSAGWGTWWSGLMYAAGFCLPLVLIVLAGYAERPATHSRWSIRSWRIVLPEGVQVTTRLLAATRLIHYVSGAAIAVAAITAVFIRVR
jgi:hypothetical protein